MFDAIGNMPLHPLVIHAVVIGIPLAVLLAFLFALPRTRSWARWPLAITAVGALVGTVVARASGQALASVVVEADSPVAPLISRHAQLATQLLAIMAVFAVLAIVTVIVVPGRSDRPGSEPKRRGAAAVILPLLLVVVGVVAAIWVVRVGDIGSRAVWNPTGELSYSAVQNR